VFQYCSAIVERKLPQRTLAVERVAGLVWPKALWNSRPGENALNRRQLLRRRLTKLPPQPGQVAM
jgi:hypothetical protein